MQMADKGEKLSLEPLTEEAVRRVLGLLDVYACDVFDMEMAANIVSTSLQAVQQFPARFPSTGAGESETATVAENASVPEGWVLVQQLADWLVKRGEPDSGIRYEASSWIDEHGRRSARVQLHGSDATFVADHFHGPGARKLASVIRAMLASAPAPAPSKDDLWRSMVQAHAAAMRMVVDAIEELFGPTASIESEDASLLRGPEPHHRAEGVIDALQRIKAAPAPDTKQEPVAFADPRDIGKNFFSVFRAATALYTIPLYPSPVATGTAEGVKVKPLRWNPFEAHTSIGRYHVNDHPGDDGLHYAALDGNNIGRFLSVEEAKWAAQADYEARIRSALL